MAVNLLDRVENFRKEMEISDEEKMDSVFELHIRLIGRGSAGCPQEPSAAVTILEEQHQLSLGCRNAWEEDDVYAAVPRVRDCLARWP